MQGALSVEQLKQSCAGLLTGLKKEVHLRGAASPQQKPFANW